MKQNILQIRFATEKDTPALLNIYAPYVEQTAITFEYTVPSVEEFRTRMRAIQARYPYLIAEKDGQLLGYAYVSPFHDRAAYDWAVETSIYVDRKQKRQGIGQKLYEALEQALTHQNILNVNACIAYADEEDARLTQDSVRFHERLGYRMVGRFHQCGYKFDRWYDMVWMEKSIGAHTVPPAPVRKISEIQPQLEQLFSQAFNS